MTGISFSMNSVHQVFINRIIPRGRIKISIVSKHIFKLMQQLPTSSCSLKVCSNRACDISAICETTNKIKTKHNSSLNKKVCHSSKPLTFVNVKQLDVLESIALEYQTHQHVQIGSEYLIPWRLKNSLKPYMLWS